MKIICSYCSTQFEACSRAKYCSGKCKRLSWYNKHKNEIDFKKRNAAKVRQQRLLHKDKINSRRRERFQNDTLYKIKIRKQTIRSRKRRPQNANNRQWRLNNPYKAMLKNLRKRGKRLVNDKDLKFIFERDKHSCQYCGSKSDLSLDHKIPVSRDGNSSIDNICLACISCNVKKGAKTPEEFALYKQELALC